MDSALGSSLAEKKAESTLKAAFRDDVGTTSEIQQSDNQLDTKLLDRFPLEESASP